MKAPFLSLSASEQQQQRKTLCIEYVLQRAKCREQMMWTNKSEIRSAPCFNGKLKLSQSDDGGAVMRPKSFQHALTFHNAKIYNARRSRCPNPSHCDINFNDFRKWKYKRNTWNAYAVRRLMHETMWANDPETDGWVNARQRVCWRNIGTIFLTQCRSVNVDCLQLLCHQVFSERNDPPKNHCRLDFVATNYAHRTMPRTIKTNNWMLRSYGRWDGGWMTTMQYVIIILPSRRIMIGSECESDNGCVHCTLTRQCIVAGGVRDAWYVRCHFFWMSLRLQRPSLQLTHVR